MSLPNLILVVALAIARSVTTQPIARTSRSTAGPVLAVDPCRSGLLYTGVSNFYRITRISFSPLHLQLLMFAILNQLKI